MKDETSDGMIRRQFMQLGASGGALAALSSCALVGGVERSSRGTARPPLSSAALAKRLRQTDVALQVIATAPAAGHLVPPALVLPPALRAEADRILLSSHEIRNPQSAIRKFACACCLGRIRR